MSEESRIRKQRNRASLVCFKCKERKIKCDRSKPCSNCVKSGQTNQCTYSYKVVKTEKELKHKKKLLELVEETVINLSRDNNYLGNSTNSNTPTSNTGNDFLSSKDCILNASLDLQRNVLILRKPSRTQAKPSLFLRKIPFPSLLLSFKKSFDIERKTWKSRNFKSKKSLLQTLIYDANIDETASQKLTQQIEKLICNNYYAVLERLNYFQSNLNEFLFDSYLPMGVVHLIFHHYFLVEPDGIHFKGVKKTYEYSFVALISSIISLTNVFTKNNQSQFKFVLPFRNNEYDELSMNLLSSFNYRRKQSIFIIYTLLNLRLTLMVYGDVQSGGVAGQNSLPYFQVAVDIAKDIGLNLNQDLVKYWRPSVPGTTNDLEFLKEIPVEALKKLWNYMLQTDATYCISISIPPIIDERYNYGVYALDSIDTSQLELFLQVVRQAALVIHSPKPITLSSFLQQTDYILKLIQSFEPLSDLKAVEQNERQWGNMYIRLKLVKYYCILNLYLYMLLSDEDLQVYYSQDILEIPENIELIGSLRESIKLKIILSFLIGSNAVLQFSENKLSEKFLIFSRDIFPDWLGSETAVIIFIIVEEEIKKKKNNRSDCTTSSGEIQLPPPPKFNIKDLELALFNVDSSVSNDFIDRIKSHTSSVYLASYITNIYEKTIEIPTLWSHYRFFAISKLLLITIYFLYCHIKNSSDGFFSASENVNKLLDQIRCILKHHFHGGRISHLLPADKLTSTRDSPVTEPDTPITPQSKIELDYYDPLCSSYMDTQNLTEMFEEINQIFCDNTT